MRCPKREQPILTRALGENSQNWVPKDDESSPIQKGKVERDIFQLLYHSGGQVALSSIHRQRKTQDLRCHLCLMSHMLRLSAMNLPGLPAYQRPKTRVFLKLDERYYSIYRKIEPILISERASQVTCLGVPQLLPERATWELLKTSKQGCGGQHYDSEAELSKYLGMSSSHCVLQMSDIVQ